MSRRFTGFIDQSSFRTADTLIENMMDLMVDNLPLFLSEDDYQRIDSLLLPENIDRAMEKNLRSLVFTDRFCNETVYSPGSIGNHFSRIQPNSDSFN